jgi:hypothetical protein
MFGAGIPLPGVPLTKEQFLAEQEKLKKAFLREQVPHLARALSLSLCLHSS